MARNPVTQDQKILDDEARISPPTRSRDGVEILDINNYAPFLLNAVASAWQRRTAPIYRQTFNISILEWRIVSMLCIEPSISAQRICEVVRLDKAAVSRALRDLNERGLAEYASGDSLDPRRRIWHLTDEGQEVHDTCMAIALEHEAHLVANVAPENLEVFLRVMRQLLRNLDS